MDTSIWTDLQRGEKDGTCYVCGPDNDLGLQVPFRPLGETGAEAHYTARPEHGGWSGILHGGVAFALIDEAMGWALYFRQIAGVTARVETHFHRPIRIGQSIEVQARVLSQNRRLAQLHAELRDALDPAIILAQADATMYLLERPASQGIRAQEASYV